MILPLLALLITAKAVEPSRTLLNNDWKFSLGYAGDMSKDFMHGTEYFTYITKAKSNRENKGPAWEGFDDSSWQTVSLPHDWVVDLPYSSEASHSHGYKCIGWKYPENSAGWYRKTIFIPESDKGSTIMVEFEGIFRNSQVFINGFFLGGEESGYQSSVYDMTDYLNYGENNVITVRCDASLEEGWFYEGAGIYRNVYLIKAGTRYIKPYSVAITDNIATSGNGATLKFSAEAVFNGTATTDGISWKASLCDKNGSLVAQSTASDIRNLSLSANDIKLWSIDSPNLYTVRLDLLYNGEISDSYTSNYGFRKVEFSPEKGFVLNGKKIILKGCNLHLDHAGVGTGVSDELWRYRLTTLQKFGFNAIRCSHNAASPSMLNLCDKLGIVVIDENREFGVNERQFSQLRRMIYRDRNHPSVILWSIGNEEWALEWDTRSLAIAEKLSAVAHEADPTRPTTYGNCSGPYIGHSVDVFGYNYIIQNTPTEDHLSSPMTTAVGTEETSGSGTRGKYVTVPENGWMLSINREGVRANQNATDKENTDDSTLYNVIERGWKYYHQNEWTGGLFYWTGTDYRGESNPMVWPATGSQFGILDYCSFPKDEAFYLKSWWSSEPVLHICGEYNNEVWVYSNCPVIELFRNGKSLGKKAMPEDSHLVWNVPSDGKNAVYTARAFDRKGKRLSISDRYPAVLPELDVTCSKSSLLADGQDVVVLEIDSNKDVLNVATENCTLLGWGNGDPGFKEIERPVGKDSQTVSSQSLPIKPFSGKALLIVRSLAGSEGTASVSFSSGDKTIKTVSIGIQKQ